ncbi:hypothetical protein HMPREF0578_0263 [Mobiluncus mulieris 28-1]|nr:hypothetical protein HMPREF0578_0263 [Mobiluncus mulieris 28-1]
MISPTGAVVAVPEEELGIYEVAGYAVADKPEVVGEPEPVKAGGTSKK